MAKCRVAANRLNPVRLAYAALPALRDRIGETVVLAVWGERGATVIALEDSAQPVTLNVRVGSILPLGNSAVGRVFAALPFRHGLRADVERVGNVLLLESALFALTANSSC